MQIEKIIYDTTREIHNLEDKLRIATIFLFCEKMGSVKFAELLYTKNHEALIQNITQEYKDFDVDFYINFKNPNVKSAFVKTLEKVKKECDGNGFLKALFEKDEFALVIVDIVNYNFDKFEIQQFKKSIEYLMANDPLF